MWILHVLIHNIILVVNNEDFDDFMHLQNNKINDNINKINNTTANTIIAASAPKIVSEIAAPIKSPNTKKKSTTTIKKTDS